MSARLSRRWLIVSAIVALTGLLALGCSITFTISMAEARDTRVYALPFLGASLASLAIIVAIPVLHSWTPPRWVRVVVPPLLWIFALIAVIGVWLVTLLFACADDGVCRPVDTWKALPSMLTSGVLTASGPGVAALMTTGEWRGRLWGLAIVLGLIGIFAALIAWVEMGIYPLG